MNYIVELDKFEGPLDLLLHLIKESSIDIVDIKIEDITKQYLDYIQKMEELDLDIASEYLIMAAELIEIKSRILLPSQSVDGEDEYEDDPREALIKKLLLYKNYKEIVPVFKELEEVRNEYYDKQFSTELCQAENVNGISSDLTMDSLIQAFKEMLLRIDKEKPINTRVVFKEYSVTKRTDEIKKIIRDKKRINFSELFTVFSKDYIVVTFLAILVLANNRELTIEQDSNFKSIMLVGK